MKYFFCILVGNSPWGFSKQERWSGLPGPPPGDLPIPGIKPRFPALQADSLLSGPPGNPSLLYIHHRSEIVQYLLFLSVISLSIMSSSFIEGILFI